MKALLIYPEYTTTFWSFKYALPFVSRKAACPPLGLLTVAGMLPDKWDLSLVDMNVRSLKESDFEGVDLVFLSAMLIQRDSTMEVLKKCREKGRKVIAGGPLFTSCPEDFMDLTDHLVLNEAEVTLRLFLDDLESGEPKKIYVTKEFPDLSLTPLPRWDLISMMDYQTLMIQCSRGCPYNCEFCDITNLFGRWPRVKSAEQVLSELQAVYTGGWRGPMFFVDDNFIGNRPRIKKILQALIPWLEEKGHPFTFTTEVSVDIVDDDELIELMAQAGFDALFVGLETPNEESLRECGKRQNCTRDMVESVKKLQSRGFQVLGGYIVGFDSDDETIFSRQIRFIQESGVVTAMVGLLNAPPETKLWHRLKAENRLLDNSSGDNTDGSINFIPRMEREKLIAGYKRIVKTIYSPRAFHLRVFNFLDSYKPRRRKGMRAREVRAFLKTIFFLGFLGNGISQWYYWKTFFKALLFYPQSFTEAMTMMVYGYHFRKVSKDI
jgi:radical SAM superfamily enzyme YgiQ (UPF0313 family)